jgi:hypothetical protein
MLSFLIEQERDLDEHSILNKRTPVCIVLLLVVIAQDLQPLAILHREQRPAGNALLNGCSQQAAGSKQQTANSRQQTAVAIAAVSW